MAARQAGRSTARGAARRAGKAAALRALKLAAAGTDRLRRPERGIVVLLYHRVGHGSGGEIDLAPELFEEQMAWLTAERSVLSLDEALDRLAAPESASHPQPGPVPDPVVVTFDDGTADLADVALPILARHRVPATVYLATDFVDSGRPFPANGTPLSWTAVREMAESGWVTVGSHTHTHALLDRLSPGEAADELDRSIGRIGENLGAAPAHFAYPKAVGARSPVEDLVRRRFRSAALAGTRANPYGAADAHRLRRSPIQASDGVRYFVRKAQGGMALEDALRGALNRVRYTGATS